MDALRRPRRRSPRASSPDRAWRRARAPCPRRRDSRPAGTARPARPRCSPRARGGGRCPRCAGSARGSRARPAPPAAHPAPASGARHRHAPCRSPKASRRPRAPSPGAGRRARPSAPARSPGSAPRAAPRRSSRRPRSARPGRESCGDRSGRARTGRTGAAPRGRSVRVSPAGGGGCAVMAIRSVRDKIARLLDYSPTRRSPLRPAGAPPSGSVRALQLGGGRPGRRAAPLGVGRR